MTDPAREMRVHVEQLSACTRCPNMTGPVIIGTPVLSKVLLVGQAPGPREGAIGRPFGWTAGRTLFRWFESIGLDEDSVRARVYIASVCRCFPGKNPASTSTASAKSTGKRGGGGDRVPSREEIADCAPWLDTEFALLRPELVLAVGKLSISQFLPPAKLDTIIGHRFKASRAGQSFDLVPLPHPSGASTWHRMEPGKTLLGEALAQVEQHPAWRALKG